MSSEAKGAEVFEASMDFTGMSVTEIMVMRERADTTAKDNLLIVAECDHEIARLKGEE
jgi:hypothetical protein